METSEFYLKVAGVLLLSLASALFLSTTMAYSGVYSGVAAISALMLATQLDRKTKKTGRTDKMKAVLLTATVLYELVIFLAAFSTPVVSKALAAITLTSIAFTEILGLELYQKLQRSYTPEIGREGRITVLAISLAGYSFNAYILYYGLVIVFLMSAYDSLKFIHQLYREL